MATAQVLIDVCNAPCSAPCAACGGDDAGCDVCLGGGVGSQWLPEYVRLRLDEAPRREGDVLGLPTCDWARPSAFTPEFRAGFGELLRAFEDELAVSTVWRPMPYIRGS